MAVVFGPRGSPTSKPAATSFLSARLIVPLACPPLTTSASSPSMFSSPITTANLFTTRKSHRLTLKQRLLNEPQSRPRTRLRQPFHPPLQRIEAFLHDVAPLAPNFWNEYRVPPVLTITSVPASAIGEIQQHLETLICRHEECPKGVKLDYNIATQSLSIISFPSWEHEHMSGIDFEIMLRLRADNNAFTGNNPRFRIVSGASANVSLPGLLPTVNPPLQRQPDGSLRLLLMDNPPFLVWEILDSQPLQEMEHKVREYFVGTAGKVRVVIILQLVRQPLPQKGGKRKRNRGSLGDEERALEIPDASLPEIDADITPTTPGEPAPSSTLPPPGTVVKGLFWVYTHATSASTNASSILCLEESREFYPHRPSGALELTWEHVFGGSSVPLELADKVLSLPYDIFYDKLAELMLPREVWPGDEVGTWDGLEVKGIQHGESEPDGSSTTASQSSWSCGDGEFVCSGGEVVVEGGVERRSTRLAIRQEATRAADSSA